MDKKQVIHKIVEKLTAELDRYVMAARAAQDGAADEQSRAENKYDTRGLEAAYLAHGQSRQIIETQEALELYTALVTKTLPRDAHIELGALVTVAGKGEPMLYFIGPGGGGIEIICEESEVVVITLQSPLGRATFGKKRGDVVHIAGEKYQIVSVE